MQPATNATPITIKLISGEEAERRAVAFHEAGHAVVARHFGLPIVRVSIEPDGDALGHVAHHGPMMLDFGGAGLARQRRTAAREMIVACFAGLSAQRIVDPDARVESAQEDFDNAWWLSREYGVLPRGRAHVGDDAHRRMMDRLRRDAERLVRQPEIRRAIAALADELLAREVVDAAEVDAVVEPLLGQR